MQSVITLRDPSIVAARMDLAEMASIVLVTANFLLKYFKVCHLLHDDDIGIAKEVLCAGGQKKKKLN